MSESNGHIEAGGVAEALGRYRLLQRLGRGTMAEVWKAKSFGIEGFEKTLVVKRILPELTERGRFADLFAAEAKLALRLSHANVVQVFDLGKADLHGRAAYFIAMEYVRGLDLGALLARCRSTSTPPPLPLCIFVAAEVAKALEHAHRRRDEQLRPLGILHRDVRPTNVLLSYEGEVKVADFAIARAWYGLEPDQGVHNIPRTQLANLSPEQALDRPLDARSDLFSLGTLLYELLTLSNPFASGNASATLERVAHAEFAPIASLRPEVPPELAAVVERALARAPEGRFLDANRMHESLFSLLYASGERYGASDLASYLAHLPSDTPPGATSFLPSDPSEGPATEGIDRRVRRSLSMPPEPPPEQDDAAETPREVAILSFALGAAGTEDLGVAAGALEAIIALYHGSLVEQSPTRIVAMFESNEEQAPAVELAVRAALLALRQVTREPPRGGAPPVEGDAVEPSAGVHAGHVRWTRDGTPVFEPPLPKLLETASAVGRSRGGGCGVSVVAARRVKGLFVFEGPPEGVDPKSVPGLVVRALRPPTSGAGRFVGRKAELKRLGELLSHATRKRTRTISMAGEPGTGKTRLLREAERRLERGTYRVGFYLCTCRLDGAVTPLSAVSEMLHAVCGTQAGDSAGRIRALEPRLRALGLHDEDVAALLGQLGASGPGAVRSGQLAGGFARMVLGLSADHLQIFAWDDAENIDSASVDVLQTALRRIGEARAVFLFASRHHPSWLEEEPTLARVELGPLDAEDLAELVAQRSGAREAPRELVSFVREHAGSNPLHAEEIVRNLAESGRVASANGSVLRLDLPSSAEAPLSLDSLIERRLARLEPLDRHSAEAIAAIGGPASLDVVSQLVGAELPAVERAIDRLEEQGVVTRPGPFTVRFVSPVLRDAVLRGLGFDERTRLHLEAARAYQRSLVHRGLDQVDRATAQLLWAGAPDDASTVHATAARAETHRGAYESAVYLYARAFEFADFERRDPLELSAWLSELADVVDRVRWTPTITALVDPLLRRIDAAATPSVHARARVDLATIFVATHQFYAAERQLEAARAMAGGDPALSTQLALGEADLAWNEGNFLRARDRFERLAAAKTDRALARRVRLRLAVACAANGDADRATSLLAEVDPGSEDPVRACGWMRCKLMVALFSRDYEAAVSSGHEALSLARGAGLTYEAAFGLHLLAQALLRQGDHPRAFACLEQSIALCEETGEARLLAHNRAFIALLEGDGRADTAETTLAESIRFASERRFLWDEADGRHLLAEHHRGRGDAGAARLGFERCLALALSVGYRLVADDCARALADLRGAPESG